MAEAIKPTTGEVVPVNTMKVTCDGPEFSKHPRVYLTMADGVNGEVVCPYCGKNFVYDPDYKES